MNLTVQDEAHDFLTYLQQLEFVCADRKTGDPSQQADAYRNLYLHLARSALAGNSCSTRQSDIKSDWVTEAELYKDKYAKIVDTMSDTGLNNFAEGALALCSFHKNESSKWITSLSVSQILQMSSLQNADCRDNVMSDPEDCLITLQTAKTISSGSPVVDQDIEQQLWSPIQQSSNRLHDRNGGLGTNNTHSGTLHFASSSNASDASYQNMNWGWHQPVISNMGGQQPVISNMGGQQPVISNMGGQQPVISNMGGHQTASENIRTTPHSRPAYTYNDPAQNYGRKEDRATSDDLLVNASKVGGPYANFGQKPKASHWTNNKRSKGGKMWMNDDEDDDGEDSHNRPLPFRTAKEQLVINQQKKFGGAGDAQIVGACYGAGKKSLGTRRGPASKFVPPVLNRDLDDNENFGESKLGTKRRHDDAMDEPTDDRLKGIEPKMIELINNEIMDHGTPVLWTDIAGLEFAKKTIKEIVVWPMLRPDIFTGLRGPPKGLLLFGPPGTGKTLIGKCIASQSKSTFFCISASSLTSKWVGEGEKMVRALFAVARCSQPAVVFIDEIDSLLSQRTETEHESSRRIKTEFLVQLDGAATSSEDRILVIGATNRPHEIDEAARRRFVKRLLIPLPEAVARQQIISNLMSHQNASLTEDEIHSVCDKTNGYSGADMTNLCREAALGPIRSIPFEMMETITPEQVRPILRQDFEAALMQVRPSVSSKDLQLYTDWNQTYGSFGH